VKGLRDFTMSYERYIRVNGKVYGPYVYKSVRENGKIRSVYLKKGKQKQADKRLQQERQPNLGFLKRLFPLLVLALR
jgi:hypothetical protein